MIINTIQISRRIILLLLIVAMLVIQATASLAKPRIALLGDSLTWIGGDNCQYPIGWSHWLSRSGIASDIDVYARSGATWTNTCNTNADTAFYSELLHDDNVIYNQVLRLTDKASNDSSYIPDIIIIFAGANDAWFADWRPGIFSIPDAIPSRFRLDFPVCKATSLLQSVALACDILTSGFPLSQIIIVTPIEMSKVSPILTSKVADIIEAAANSRNVMTIRADQLVDIRHSIECKSPHFTSDGVHTNADGAKLIADVIIEMIEKLSPQKNLRLIP